MKQKMKQNSSICQHQTITLHSTASHGATYLFRLIDAAIWLLKQKQPNHETPVEEIQKPTIKIILHPVGGALTPRGLMGRYKGQVKSFLRPWLKGQFLSNLDQYSSQEEVLSIYQKVYQAHQTVTLETQLGNVEINLSKIPLGRSPLSGIGCYSQALKMWWSCHDQGNFIPIKFLSLKYQGITIGDLIASRALRSNPQAGGSLKTCPHLFSFLVKALFICDYICYELPDNLVASCVTVPEPTYLHGLYKRLLHQRGATVLEVHHYATEFQLIEPNQPLPNPRIANRNNSSLSEAERTCAQTYLQERIYDPQKHLWYMLQGYNRTDEQLLNTEGNPIAINT